MSPRTLVLVAGLLALLGLGAAVVAGWAARTFYVRSKVAALTPVRLEVYQQENAALEPTGRPRVVLIGDSRIREWRVEAPDWELLNRGIGGETVAQLQFRFGADALALEPTVIVLQAGINDLVAAVALGARGQNVVDRTRAALQDLAEQAATRDVRVLLLTIIPPARPPLLRRLVWSDDVYAHVERINRDLLEWRPPPGIQVVDTAGLLGAQTRLPPKLARDTLHLNAAGYELLTAELQRRLAALSQAPPSSAPTAGPAAGSGT